MQIPAKVLHVTLSMGTGGIENLILDLCRYADRDRFQPAVLCLDEAGDLFEELAAMGVPGYLEKRVPGLDWRLIGRLASLFRKRAFDVVHCHNQASAFYAGTAAFLARVPACVITEHSRNYIHERTIRRMEKRVICSLLDTWVNVSHELAQKSREDDGLPEAKLEVILNGVDCERFSRPDPKVVQEIRAANNLEPQDRVLVMVARLVPIKNHELMLGALQLLGSDLGNVKLLLVGDGERREALQGKVRELGLAGRVIFLGMNRNIPELLALSDLFVLCSHSEGLPLSLLEASAAKVPVVITENSNCANFIRNLENGIVVKDDAASLAQGISASLTNVARSAELSWRAQKDVEEKFSLKCTVQRYQELYSRLLMQRGARA